MADPHLLGVQILDEAGRTRNMVMPVASTATVLQMQTFLDVFLDKLDNAIGGKITGAFVTLALDISQMVAPKGAPVAEHSVKNGALLSFVATGTKYRSSIFIPAYLNTEINASDQVLNAGASAALITSILSGEANIDVTDMAGRDLDSFLEGSAVHRK